MAYDEELADRIRASIGPGTRFTEKAMFGGLAFLVGGNLAIAASPGGCARSGGPEQSDKLVRTTKATVAVMRGRRMAGWLRVAPEDLRTDRQLAKWVTLGTACATALPPKRAAKAGTGKAGSGKRRSSRG